jgi:hypothetical protein
VRLEGHYGRGFKKGAVGWAWLFLAHSFKRSLGRNERIICGVLSRRKSRPDVEGAASSLKAHWPTGPHQPCTGVVGWPHPLPTGANRGFLPR